MPREKHVRNNRPRKSDRSPVGTGKLLVGIGASLIALALILIALIFWPVILNELSYRFMRATQTKNADSAIIPKDKNAGIVIPKIRANAALVLDVDPYNAKAYQQALTKGVAHAKGTAYPGQIGNVFLFSHSSQDLLTANRYNSIFYLLSKLVEGDEIDLFYRGNRYVYTVTGHKVIKPDAISYLTGKTNQRTLTLMTCWPPGTTLQRYIVTAEMEP